MTTEGFFSRDICNNVIEYHFIEKKTNTLEISDNIIEHSHIIKKSIEELTKENIYKMIIKMNNFGNKPKSGEYIIDYFRILERIVDNYPDFCNFYEDNEFYFFISVFNTIWKEMNYGHIPQAK